MTAQVLSLEERRGEWGFKALKQMMKILFKMVTLLPAPSTFCLSISSDLQCISLQLKILTSLIFYPFPPSSLHPSLLPSSLPLFPSLPLPLPLPPSPPPPPSHPCPPYLSFPPSLPPEGSYEDMKQRYRQLLTYIKDVVTKNQSEKSINSILDYISTSHEVCLRDVLGTVAMSQYTAIWALLHHYFVPDVPQYIHVCIFSSVRGKGEEIAVDKCIPTSIT